MKGNSKGNNIGTKLEMNGKRMRNGACNFFVTLSFCIVPPFYFHSSVNSLIPLPIIIFIFIHSYIPFYLSFIIFTVLL
jgi:hypothetical protein